MYDYKEFKYLYPPRPDFVLTYDRIPYYESDGWVGQFKKNGTCTIIAMSPEGEFHAMNRHAEEHKAWFLTAHIKNVLRRYLPKGEWTVLVAEIMHSKTPTIKDTVYIHDVIVHQSRQLVGTTFAERQKLLIDLLPSEKECYSHYEVDEKVWRAKLITTDILKAFHDIADPKIDEGIVLKKLKGKLKECYRADANCAWQAKVRYATKNYQF
jgi:hypothetical protein